jgi:hypothetical protein
MELVEEPELIMHKVEAEHRTPLGRILRLEYYKRAKQIIKEFKEVFVLLRQSRILRLNVRPYQERQWLAYGQPCST